MRVKRTYNLSSDVVETVRTLVTVQHVARTQDALIEDAVREYYRQVRDREDTKRWAAAATDQEFQAEMDVIWTAFQDEDAGAWEA